MSARRAVSLAVIAAAALLVAGCATSSPTRAVAGSLTATSTDDGCRLSASEAPAGVVTIEVKNAGTKVTEFYLLDSDGLRAVGEMENIGPGISRKLID